jgi:hypothetical protein
MGLLLDKDGEAGLEEEVWSAWMDGVEGVLRCVG